MTYKWIGAMLVIISCGGWGCSMVAQQRRQEKLLHQLTQAVSFMTCELQYRLTPLPELCSLAGREATGQLRQVFRALAEELEKRSAPEVAGCMNAVLRENQDLPGSIRRLLHQLGRILGRFDLPGQLQGLSAVQAACEREQKRLAENRELKFRNCQTLGLCAGAALVILFA